MHDAFPSAFVLRKAPIQSVTSIKYLDGTTGVELWKTDGTYTGTVKLTKPAGVAPIKFTVLKVRNESGRSRRLSATGYVEWVLGDLRPKSAMTRSASPPT